MVASLEEVVHKILGLSGPNDLTQLQKALNREADEAAQANPHGVPAAVAQLDVQQHSLGMVYLL